MDELDALRKKKLAEIEAQAREEHARKERMAQAEDQIRAVLTQILTPEARSRLANIKAAKPDYASQIELLLVQLAQSGQLKDKITDAQLKNLLTRVSKPKTDFRIRRV